MSAHLGWCGCQLVNDKTNVLDRYPAFWRAVAAGNDRHGNLCNPAQRGCGQTTTALDVAGD